VLSKKPSLERYPCHNNLPERSRLKSRTLAERTDRHILSAADRERAKLGEPIGIAILTRSDRVATIEPVHRQSLQSRRDNAPIDIHHSHLGNIRIVDLQWQQTFTLERSPIDTDYQICVPISGEIEWQGIFYPATTALAIDPDRAFPRIASTNGRVLVVGFDRQSIESVLAKLLDRDLKQPLSFESEIDLDTDFGTSLKEFIEFLGRAGAPGLNIASPTIQAELASALLTCLLKGVKHNYSDEILYHCQGAFAFYVKQASLYIEAHLQDEIELADIAAAVNVSPRLLQKAFAQEYDCSPMRFVARTRLERIRQELERSSDTTRIIDVMMNYGITQGGKFAREYQQLFGEKPSDTLKRAHQNVRDRQPLWEEIDDLRSARIVGGVTPLACGNLAFPVNNPLFPCLGNPTAWDGYLRSIGIHLTDRLIQSMGIN
jgi:AraC-like DNA-binding protein